MAGAENQPVTLTRRQFLLLGVPAATALIVSGAKINLFAAPGGELSAEDLARFERTQLFLGDAEALRALAQEEMNIRFKLVSFSYADEPNPQPELHTHVIDVEFSRLVEDEGYIPTANAHLRTLEGIVAHGMHGTNDPLDENWGKLRGYIRVDDVTLTTAEVEAALGGIVSAPRFENALWYPDGREEFFDFDSFTPTNTNTAPERSFLPVPNNGPYIPPIYARQVPTANEGFNLQPSQPQSTGITAPQVPGTITNEGVTMGAAKKLVGQVLAFLAGTGVTGLAAYGLSRAFGGGQNQQQSETK